jgi:hypothetical protein
VSDSFSAEMLAGGTVRVSSASPSDAVSLQQWDQSSRELGGVVRDDGTGNITTLRPVTDNGSSEGTAGRGVMATLRNNFGAQRIDSSSTVEIDGMRTSLKNAADLGYIREVSPGHYEDVAAPSSTDKQAPNEQAGQAPELFDTQTEADWNADIEPLPQEAYDSAIAGAAAAVIDPTDASWEKLATTLAQNANLPPALAAEYLDAGYGVFEGQVAKMAEGLGIDGTEKERFYDWVRNNKPQELTRAVQELTTVRRLDTFRALAADYKRTTGPAQLDQWRGMGFDAFVDSTTGDVMVKRGNGNPVRARELLKR